uniref:Uncharacterized protein n=1 Tax=Cohnella candidum TaxID=2674991 RepID=A0A3G3K1Y6_9BACL|nr:hypothetical protein EAV92_19015 [Cohnella candidum]
MVEVNDTEFQGDNRKRLRVFSIPVGAGIANSVLDDTGLFTCVGGVDVWNAAMWIPKADVTWLSCDCTDFSVLGLSGQDIVGGLAPHYA